MKARVDFHIHSCLSPCASLDMSPRVIVERSRAAGMDCIALTDHSCVENLPAFHEACAEVGMACLYGTEVTTSEGPHVLCLFDQLDRGLEFGRMVYDRLPPYPNYPERFGEQPIVTVDEEIVGFVEKLLFNATDISFFDLVSMVHDAGGLCIPSHIYREVHGAIPYLGFMPDLPYDAVEAIGEVEPEVAAQWPVARFSDAHEIDHLARRFTEIETEDFSVPSLRTAFQNLL